MKAVDSFEHPDNIAHFKHDCFLGNQLIFNEFIESFSINIGVMCKINIDFMYIPLPYVLLLTDIFTPTQPSSSESYLKAADTLRLYVEPLTRSLKQSQYLPYRPRVSHSLL